MPEGNFWMVGSVRTMDRSLWGSQEILEFHGFKLVLHFSQIILCETGHLHYLEDLTGGPVSLLLFRKHDRTA